MVEQCTSPHGKTRVVAGRSGRFYTLTRRDAPGEWEAEERDLNEGRLRYLKDSDEEGLASMRPERALALAWLGPPPEERYKAVVNGGSLSAETVEWRPPDYSKEIDKIKEITDPIEKTQSLKEQIYRLAQGVVEVYRKKREIKKEDLPDNLSLKKHTSVRTLLEPSSSISSDRAFRCLSPKELGTNVRIVGRKGSWREIKISSEENKLKYVKDLINDLILSFLDQTEMTNREAANFFSTHHPYISKLRNWKTNPRFDILCSMLEDIGLGLEFSFQDFNDIRVGEPTFNLSRLSGYVYVATNPNFPKRFVKIGMTKKEPEERIHELSTPVGVPGEYRLSYSKNSIYYRELERNVHKRLKHRTVPDENEFFYVLPEEAKSTIMECYKEPI